VLKKKRRPHIWGEHRKSGWVCWEKRLAIPQAVFRAISVIKKKLRMQSGAAGPVRLANLAKQILYVLRKKKCPVF
jgi:hypothetical protein